MKLNNETFPVEVFIGMQWEAEMVKNLLENENIEAFLTDQIIGTLVPFYSTPGLGSVKVVVSNLDFEKAKLIVSEFENSRKE